ncbi:GntR family transcriptional regulator [Streptomyces sp. CC77]|uniref:GntR family transcriptional regulator n=1 Tax=Streptomyces sp. CC77 TaxID=1906739 RepID=UPI0008DCF99E|nr:GntR family transcriptional regulator [Streptomyces sp. CC77]OII67623.1 GntR family transcriptional regulator [Streptomyces sp. CC77]
MNVPTAEAERDDSRPLHERIAADLRDEIMSGDLAPSARVPSTARLKERFRASSATVQKALQLLKAEGLVVGRAGAAVTVREHRQRTMRPAAYMAPAGAGEAFRWLTEAAKTGGSAHSALLEVSEAVPPADVRGLLGMAAGDTAVLRRQLLSIGDEPAELVSSYYPLELAGGTAISVRRKIRGGTPALLAERGFPPVRSVDRVSARMPTQEQAAVLRLPGHLPVLRTLRVVYSHGDRPVEATVMIKAGHLYELEYEFAAEE